MKYFLTLLLLITLTVTVSAQKSKKFYVGAKAGLNLSTLQPENIEEENLKTGVMGGLFFKIRPVNFIGFQPEFLYVAKGSEIVWDDPVQPGGSFMLNMDYLDVPMFLVMHLGNKFDIHFGPQFSYLVNFEVKNLEDSGLDFESVIQQNHFKNYDFAGIAGAELTLNKVQIGARYNMGVIEISESDLSSPVDLKKSKNQSTQVFLGLIF